MGCKERGIFNQEFHWNMMDYSNEHDGICQLIWWNIRTNMMEYGDILYINIQPAIIQEVCPVWIHKSCHEKVEKMMINQILALCLEQKSYCWLWVIRCYVVSPNSDLNLFHPFLSPICWLYPHDSPWHPKKDPAAPLCEQTLAVRAPIPALHWGNRSQLHACHRSRSQGTTPVYMDIDILHTHTQTQR